MAFVHRLVFVLAFFGALVMAFVYGGIKMEPQYLPVVLLVPLLAAAIIVYPVAWLVSGVRR